MCVLIHKLALESLHVCSIHKPHMDPPLLLHVVLSTNHTWINKWSLHVCSFHKPHMDQPVVIASVLFPQTTHGSTTRVIACVFFPQTTHGSTTRVIACVL